MNHTGRKSVIFWKLTNMEKEYSTLKAKKATPAPAPSKPKGPYSDPLLKAFFCPKLPEEELAELRKEKRELIANLASMKDENMQEGFQNVKGIFIRFRMWAIKSALI